jgi:hypothetical protein
MLDISKVDFCSIIFGTAGRENLTTTLDLEGYVTYALHHHGIKLIKHIGPGIEKSGDVACAH